MLSSSILKTISTSRAQRAWKTYKSTTTSFRRLFHSAIVPFMVLRELAPWFVFLFFSPSRWQRCDCAGSGRLRNLVAPLAITPS